MIYLLLIAGAIAVAMFAGQSSGSAPSDDSSDSSVPQTSPDIAPLESGQPSVQAPNQVLASPSESIPSTIGPNVMGMQDCSPTTQGGNFSTKYDDIFARVAFEMKVPYALLKAHAIRESSINASAYRQEPSGKASYGLMQVLWWPSSQRFQRWGFDDDNMQGGELLYDPWTNCTISAHIMLDNWSSFGTIRDMINAYNTGKSENAYEAPFNYVDDVLKYYNLLTGANYG